MAGDARVPGKGWYWLAGAVALAGVVAMAALIAWFVLTLDKGAQFLAPGRHAVRLDRPGTYLVWNDYRTVFQGRSYDESEKLPSGVRISVLDRAGGRSLEVSASLGATSSIGDTHSVSVSQFVIERPGSYEIAVEGDFPQRVFSVSRNFVPGLLWTIFGAFALLFGGFGVATAIAAWAFIKREDRQGAGRVQAAAVPDAPAGAPAREQSLKNIAAIVYGLQLASFLVGITIIAAVIVNYVKRGEVEGTWLESHFRWQIRTFWYSLLWFGIGLASLIVVIGFFVLMAAAIWLLYRAVKGWVALEEGKAMYQG
ncbi:MAG TPA: hypothetical protein VFO57_13490 [Burkholderiales bacterium]|nr:hypothetical protein [Burkholderiales bacterium]